MTESTALVYNALAGRFVTQSQNAAIKAAQAAESARSNPSTWQSNVQTSYIPTMSLVGGGVGYTKTVNAKSIEPNTIYVDKPVSSTQVEQAPPNSLPVQSLKGGGTAYYEIPTPALAGFSTGIFQAQKNILPTHGEFTAAALSAMTPAQKAAVAFRLTQERAEANARSKVLSDYLRYQKELKEGDLLARYAERSAEGGTLESQIERANVPIVSPLLGGLVRGAAGTGFFVAQSGVDVFTGRADKPVTRLIEGFTGLPKALADNPLGAVGELAGGSILLGGAGRAVRAVTKTGFETLPNPLNPKGSGAVAEEFVAARIRTLATGERAAQQTTLLVRELGVPKELIPLAKQAAEKFELGKTNSFTLVRRVARTPEGTTSAVFDVGEIKPIVETVKPELLGQRAGGTPKTALKFAEPAATSPETSALMAQNALLYPKPSMAERLAVEVQRSMALKQAEELNKILPFSELSAYARGEAGLPPFGYEMPRQPRVKTKFPKIGSPSPQAVLGSEIKGQMEIRPLDNPLEYARTVFAPKKQALGITDRFLNLAGKGKQEIVAKPTTLTVKTIKRLGVVGEGIGKKGEPLFAENIFLLTKHKLGDVFTKPLAPEERGKLSKVNPLRATWRDYGKARGGVVGRIGGATTLEEAQMNFHQLSQFARYHYSAGMKSYFGGGKTVTKSGGVEIMRLAPRTATSAGELENVFAFHEAPSNRLGASLRTGLAFGGMQGTAPKVGSILSLPSATKTPTRTALLYGARVVPNIQMPQITRIVEPQKQVVGGVNILGLNSQAGLKTGVRTIVVPAELSGLRQIKDVLTPKITKIEAPVIPKLVPVGRTNFPIPPAWWIPTMRGGGSGIIGRRASPFILSKPIKTGIRVKADVFSLFLTKAETGRYAKRYLSTPKEIALYKRTALAGRTAFFPTSEMLKAPKRFGTFSKVISGFKRPVKKVF